MTYGINGIKLNSVLDLWLFRVMDLFAIVIGDLLGQQVIDDSILLHRWPLKNRGRYLSRFDPQTCPYAWRESH